MRTDLVSRRTLLVGGLATGTVFATVGGLRLPSAGDGYLALSEREAEVVAAVADAMFPGEPFPVGGVDAGVVHEVDRIVADSIPQLHAAGFRYMLRVLEWGTLASRGVRFSDLSRADRTEVLSVWGEPGVLARRVAFDALKAVMGMAYFAHPAVQAHMGWRSTCAAGGMT